MYRKFAYIYDDLINRDFDYRLWYEYIEAILRKEEVNSKDLLELAMGTGNMAYYLLEAGYNYTGLDLSEDMLAIAYNKLADYGRPKLIRQNMAGFELDKKFDIILSLCDSMNYLLEDEELVGSFRQVNKHLNDGGIFIFDINSNYKFERLLANNTFIDETDRVFYSWENFNEGKIWEFYLNFFLEKEEGLYERFEESHYERAYSEEEVEEALRLAGFKDFKKYKAFSFEPVDQETERINYIIRK